MLESVVVSMRVHVSVQDVCEVLCVCVCVGGHKYVNLSTSKAETRRQKCVVYMFFCCVFLTYIEFTITL